MMIVSVLMFQKKNLGDGCASYDYCDVLVSINVGDGSASYDYCDVSRRD